MSGLGDLPVVGSLFKQNVVVNPLSVPEPTFLILLLTAPGGWDMLRYRLRGGVVIRVSSTPPSPNG